MKNKNKCSLYRQDLEYICISSTNFQYVLTCSELRMVNIQANTLDSWLTANRPNTHVIPSKGSSIIVAFIMHL